jgi:hypothetical protein
MLTDHPGLGVEILHFKINSKYLLSSTVTITDEVKGNVICTLEFINDNL